MTLQLGRECPDCVHKRRVHGAASSRWTEMENRRPFEFWSRGILGHTRSCWALLEAGSPWVRVQEEMPGWPQEHVLCEHHLKMVKLQRQASQLSSQPLLWARPYLHFLILLSPKGIHTCQSPQPRPMSAANPCNPGYPNRYCQQHERQMSPAQVAASCPAGSTGPQPGLHTSLHMSHCPSNGRPGWGAMVKYSPRLW